MDEKENLTPLLKQYFRIKEKYKDEILFFRMGDFYEMFSDDAILASKILDIVLTSRCDTPMCGIPSVSINNYIPKLLKEGFKIAICEQFDTNNDKKLVERKVVRIITPGTLVEENLLDEKNNNFLLSIFPKKNNFVLLGFGIGIIDISTGDLFVTFLSGEKNRNLESAVISEIKKISPKEILINKNFEVENKNLFTALKNLDFYYSCIENAIDEENLYKENEKILSVLKEKISNNDFDNIKESIFLILDYIGSNYSQVLQSIKNIHFYNTSDFVSFGENTVSHLELIENSFDKTRKYSLLDILDNTITKMGSRLLKNWLLMPLYSVEKIEIRLNFTKFFYENYSITNDFRNILKNFNDIERILNRIVCSNNSPLDIISLKNFLYSLPDILNLFINSLEEFYCQNFNTKIKEKKTNFTKNFLFDFLENKNLDLGDEFLKKINYIKEILSDKNLEEVFILIDKYIVDNPPNVIKDGNIIKENASKELDEYKNIKNNARTIIFDYENEIKTEFNVQNIKIKFNNIFGYFFEISKNAKISPPNSFIRIQTLSNVERYTTEKLKKYEVDLMNIETKVLDLELKLYDFVRNKIKENFDIIAKTIKIIAELDIFANFGIEAINRNYIMPEVDNSYDIVIKEGRHPVIELISDNSFVSNDVDFLEKKSHFFLITGPNMAGKSTYIRQVALLVIMAQIGSFVPASSAKIGIIDKIFTRIGAGDKLIKGESTFFVEMKETKSIIDGATNKSLIILDEIGRGTSTFDGISIAWAVSIYLINKNDQIGPKTLFATHYFELSKLSEIYKIVKNLSLLIDEKEDKIEFLHKIIENKASKSYGIYVAKLAGLPDEILDIAKNKLLELENINYDKINQENKKSINLQKIENKKFIEENKIINDIKNININELTPINAILKIQEWKNIIQ